MAKKTLNYNLIKPEYDEQADVELINANADIIDSELKERDTRIGPLASLLTRVKTSIVNALNGLQGDVDAHLAETMQDADITVTVGVGGDFSTINDALTYLSRKHPEYKK